MEIVRHEIFDRVHLDMMSSRPEDSDFEYIGMPEKFSYFAFCEDFGPLNMLCIYRFCKDLEQLLEQRPSKNVVVWGDNNKSYTNAALLLGAYLIIHFGQRPDEVMTRFKSVADRLLSYRDVSPGPQKFALYLQDCWEALERAQHLGWLDFGTGPLSFDPEEYEHYANPLNADLHVIVPGKLIAFAGPVSFPNGNNWRDTASGCRHFAPHYALDILRDFGVHAVVRLNAPEYDATVFADGGVALADLCFEDCSTPPPDVVLKFMTLAERLPGPIAVHCKAGLGRTGTLIALYLMKHCEFSARQAIAWLRMIRPGSVIGRQQDFLCQQERHMPRARLAYARGAAAAAAGASPPDSPSAASSASEPPSPSIAAAGGQPPPPWGVACEGRRRADALRGMISEIVAAVDRLPLRAACGAAAAAAAATAGLTGTQSVPPPPMARARTLKKEFGQSLRGLPVVVEEEAAPASHRCPRGGGGSGRPPRGGGGRSAQACGPRRSQSASCLRALAEPSDEEGPHWAACCRPGEPTAAGGRGRGHGDGPRVPSQAEAALGRDPARGGQHPSALAQHVSAAAARRSFALARRAAGLWECGRPDPSP